MTRPIPGLNELMRAGVRRSVAAEYRRLLTAGVNPEAAGVLARSTPESGLRPAQMTLRGGKITSEAAGCANTPRPLAPPLSALSEGGHL